MVMLGTQHELRVVWTLGSEGDPDREHGECSLAEWLEANEYLDWTTADVMAFARSETVRGGGGAAPEWTATLIVPKGGA